MNCRPDAVTNVNIDRSRAPAPGAVALMNGQHLLLDKYLQGPVGQGRELPTGGRPPEGISRYSSTVRPTVFRRKG